MKIKTESVNTALNELKTAAITRIAAMPTVTMFLSQRFKFYRLHDLDNKQTNTTLSVLARQSSGPRPITPGLPPRARRVRACLDLL